jgi:amino acid transporter
LILAGPVGDWNRGFMIGFWSYFLEFMIISFGYLMLMTCLAEMTSIVAFASGAYGYVRCSVGPFVGYLIGVCELLENSFVSITCVYAFAYGATATSGMSRNFEPLWMLLCYVGLFVLHSRGGWYFWTSMCIFAVLTVALVVLYCLCVMASPATSAANLVDEPHEKFVDGGAGFMENLYRPMWLYIGAETLTIAGKNIANVRSFRVFDLPPCSALTLPLCRVV